MNSRIVHFGVFAPDQSAYNPELADSIAGAMPVGDGWGPIADFTSYGSGLPTACKGAITVRLTDGTFEFYAATATKLYKYNRTSSSFDDVTRSSGGDYALPDGFKWSMVQFGNLLIATNGSDAVQSINIDSGTNFAALGGSPPVSRYVGSMGEFLVLAGLSSDYKAIQWSGIGNAEFWTIGQRGCDRQSLPVGGEVTGFVGFEKGGIVLKRSATYRVSFTGGVYTFSTDVVQKNVGAIGEPSIVAFRNTFFFVSDGGFYQGVEAKPIGDERVNRYLTENADLALLQETQGTADPVNKMAWWVVVKSDASTVMLGYHWLLDRWCVADMAATYITSGGTPGYSIDDIDSFGTIDTLPYSLDARAWQGGELALAGFNNDGDFGFFQGNNLAATLETNDIPLVPGMRAYVKDIRLISDAAATDYTAKVAGRDNPGASLEWTSSITPNTISGRCLARKRGRTHRAQFTLPSGAVWNNANGVEFVFKPAGNR